MELRQIEAFLAVVDQGGFTRAARRLHLTQPAITRQVAALERLLGADLFDRTGRGVRLTVSGEAFLGPARRLIQTADEARDAVAQIASGQGGRLTVGASSTLATYILPPVLATYRLQHPSIDLSLRTGTAARMRALALSGEVDLALVTTEGAGGAEHPALEFRALGPYETCLALPTGHPAAMQTHMTAALVAAEPLLVMEPGTNLRAFTDRVLAAADVVPPRLIELDSVETIKRMVEAGLGLALLPAVAVQSEVADGRLALLTLAGIPIADRGIAVTYRRDRYLAGATRAFLALLAP
jgi:DNA-binding transcriptional LysR family regulator